MRIFTLVGALLVTIFTYSQDYQGYYISTNNQRVEGYYKSTDFSDPSSLIFKKNANSEFSKLNENDIIEYGIANQYKFKKFSVEVDRSNFHIKKLSVIKDPEWESVTVFLNILVEGDATLYSYAAYNGVKYFFTVKNTVELPTQLVYKQYMPVETKISVNNLFRQQLFNLVNCNNEQVSNFLSIAYDKKSLSEVFSRYNKCSGSASAVYDNKTGKKSNIHINVFAGVYNTSFGINNTNPETKKGNSINFSLGAETSIVTAGGKWELFGRLEYERLSGETKSVDDQGYNILAKTYKIDTDVFNIHIGPRYNYIINDTNKLFIDAAIVLSLPLEKELICENNITTNAGVNYDAANTTYQISTALSGNIGIGYVFADKFGIDIRYKTNRNMFDGSPSGYTTHLSGLGVNLRYTIN